MKALCVKSPWSVLIWSGLKTIETRTWKTKYRGDLLICNSKKPAKAEGLIINPGKTAQLRSIEFPKGGAVCVARLVDCRLMTKADEKDACCRRYPGAYAWVLKDIEPIKPFSVKGQLGLFDVNTTVEEAECRICGCTNSQACPDGCYWVSVDLCSQCVGGNV